MGLEILVQTLHLFQLILKKLSFGHPINGNPPEFVVPERKGEVRIEQRL
jgi:hypothetical protein